MEKLFELLEKVANENGYTLILDGEAILVKKLEVPTEEKIEIQTFGIGNGIGVNPPPSEELDR